MKLFAAFFASCIVIFGTVAGAEQIDDILSKMQEANTGIAYEGTLTTVLINSPFPRSYQYKVSNYGNLHRKEELLTEGMNKEIDYDDGTHLWRFFPHKNLVIKEKSRNLRLLQYQVKENLELVRQNYDVQILGEYDLNSRRGHRILFKPIVGDRPQQIFWIDEQTGVPFRTEKYGTNNQLVSVSSFSKIAFSSPSEQDGLFLKVPPHTLMTEILEKGNLTLAEAYKLTNGRVYVPQYIPSGFKLKNIIMRIQGGTKILQLFYSDGLSSLSIFQRHNGTLGRKPFPHFLKIKVGTKEAFLCTSGSLNTLNMICTPIKITLMGELFQEEMVKVGSSLTPTVSGVSFGSDTAAPQ
ncbi:MAG: hypothetical protein JXD19_06265 [Deltaproteobacteria bacterium]|nr:hypothetical protein [Deltaproteobacteria bacterium]